MKYHEPVLTEEILSYLAPAPGKKFIDATLGGGGHTKEILRLGARVLALDRDTDAIAHVQEQQKLAIADKQLIVEKANFNEMQKIATKNNFDQVDGILYDLGLSSHQLEEAGRGFSFQKEGPLDMRMDKNLPITASDIVNNFEERRLSEILETYGQENLSRPIARAIYSARNLKPIETTTSLAQVVSEVYEKKHVRVGINPATRTFQALRIVVNSELLNLEESFPQTVKIMKKKGRLVVVSYHSLEDAIVKRFIKSDNELTVLTKKPIGPTLTEIEANPRARSAKLRAAEKTN